MLRHCHVAAFAAAAAIDLHYAAFYGCRFHYAIADYFHATYCYATPFSPPRRHAVRHVPFFVDITGVFATMFIADFDADGPRRCRHDDTMRYAACAAAVSRCRWL